MTEATRHTPGTPCWVSLMVHGIDATQEFYGALFGWEFAPGPQQLGPYVRAMIDGREVAGIGRLPADRDLPVAWTPYLATDDADATAEAVRSCGGTVGVGPLDAGDAGRMVIGSDPSGAVLGIWQAAGHRGTAVHGAHGTPVWNELVTREASAVAKFYQAVLGIETRPAGAPGEDLLTLLVGGRPVGSVRGAGRELSRERGPHWMTWFEVRDTDAAARAVEELGGRVVRPPGPGPAGREAVVADPEGAVFTVVRREGNAIPV
ncbi:VOC family protein [Streptomyces sp. NPDC005805]|uniref:VOC family protein n=1 Tax=Streptomyces sp. NPDC005805 TaxID=3157068 RepID=UPI0033ECC0CB